MLTLLDGTLREVPAFKVKARGSAGHSRFWLLRKASIVSEYLRTAPRFLFLYPSLYFLNLKIPPIGIDLSPPEHVPPPYCQYLIQVIFEALLRILEGKSSLTLGWPPPPQRVCAPPPASPESTAALNPFTTQSSFRCKSELVAELGVLQLRDPLLQLTPSVG